MDNHNEKKTKQIKRILAIITIVFVILIGYFIGRPLVHFVSDPKQFRVWVNDIVHGSMTKEYGESLVLLE